MILETIREINNLLASYNEQQIKWVNKFSVNDISKVKRNISKGKWSVLTYNCEADEIGTEDIRIIPFMEGVDWPLGHVMPYMEFGTDFRNFKALFFEGKMQVGYKKRAYCEKMLQNWDNYYKAVLPVYKLLGGKDDLKLFKEMVFNKSSWPSEEYASEEEYLPKIRELKLSIDPSPENYYLYELIDKFQDRDYVPELPTIDLGIYENRILSMIASRTTLESGRFEIQNIAMRLLQIVNFAHGFDCEGSDVYDRPSCTETALEVFYPIGKLFLTDNLEKLNIEIKETPQFYIAKSMADKKGNYTGIAHLEMAALYDEQLNDPKTAWKYLVSAGYWAGRSMPEAQTKIIEQAMYLCDKRGWTEAYQVLEHNLKILNS